jgi:hypothetical protein
MGVPVFPRAIDKTLRLTGQGKILGLLRIEALKRSSPDETTLRDPTKFPVDSSRPECYPDIALGRAGLLKKMGY